MSLNQYNEVRYDYIAKVPKTRKENLQFRQRLYQRCAKSHELRQAMISACRSDTLFFFNAFCWVYEPRPGMPCGTGKIPFITWPHQDRAILVMDENWGLNDIRFWKTRGEGATWLVTMRVLKDWIFDDPWNPGAFGLVSRNEDTVDSPDDPDSLMWKLDWELKQLPRWMVPGDNGISRKVSEHSLKNKLNDSTVIGYSASEDVGSGGRKRVFFMDELAKFGSFRKGADYAAMASTFPVTECRIVVSTPKGTANAYHDAIIEDVDVEQYDVTRKVLTEDDHKSFREKSLVVLHWTDNPIRNRGLFYVSKSGEIQEVDKEKYGELDQEYVSSFSSTREMLEKKGFRVLDSVRSPWYDRQCLRKSATPQSIAQELDLDFGGSGGTLFKSDVLDVMKRCIRRPMYEMEVFYDQYTLEPDFIRHPHGTLKVWQPLQPDVLDPPVGEKYVVGVDIASGLGGSPHSNSVASVISKSSGEQVAEWANNSTPPEEFADVCVSIAKWFNNAELIHEANGPFGGAFIKRVLDRKYSNIYIRRQEFRRSRKRTKEYGWGSQQQSKPAMVRGLIYKIKQGFVKPRSKALIDECRSWVMEGGRVVNSKAISTTDDTSKNEAHGDRVVALGVAALLYEINLGKAESDEEDDEPSDPPANTMAGRLKDYDEKRRKNFEDILDW